MSSLAVFNPYTLLLVSYNITGRNAASIRRLEKHLF
jgi:hypothetical protein